MKALVEWSPRAGNKEADALANGVCNEFNLVLRIPVYLANLVWDALPPVLEIGRTAEREYWAAKKRSTQHNRGKKQQRRKPEEMLKVVDPW